MLVKVATGVSRWYAINYSNDDPARWRMYALSSWSNAVSHVNDVTGASWCLKSPPILLFVQPFVHAYIKENIRARVTGPLWWESNGDRWIPSQRASYVENDPIPWHHHGRKQRHSQEFSAVIETNLFKIIKRYETQECFSTPPWIKLHSSVSGVLYFITNFD